MGPLSMVAQAYGQLGVTMEFEVSDLQGRDLQEQEELGRYPLTPVVAPVRSLSGFRFCFLRMLREWSLCCSGLTLLRIKGPRATPAFLGPWSSASSLPLGALSHDLYGGGTGVCGQWV